MRRVLITVGLVALNLGIPAAFLWLLVAYPQIGISTVIALVVIWVVLVCWDEAGRWE